MSQARYDGVVRSTTPGLVLAFVHLAGPAAAQAEPLPPAESTPRPADPAPPPPVLMAPREAAPPEEERMSEGRQFVSAYHSGFEWGISPGVVFNDGKAGFFLGLRLGYGFDLGPIIAVPGVRLAGYFTDPNVYVGMPTFKVVFPIDRFAPFLEGGAGVGHVTENGRIASANGAALMGGGGLMIHFARFAFGAEASYQVITGTDFKGFGIGPILAFGF